MTSHNNKVRILVAGDVFPNLPEGRFAFDRLRDLLGSADYVVGNCEGVYCDRPAPSPSHKHMMVAPSDRGAFLGEVPFHAMSLANNHMMDGGYVGLSDTIDLLSGQGIASFGAGRALADAVAPHIVERGGRRLAFLGFCSVFPVGYEARANRPGIAPLRVRTLYADPDPNFWEPGIDPVIITQPVAEDLERYRDAISAARRTADVVIVLPHWGYSSRLEILQDYEVQLARDAVDHGADVVLCAHHHSLRPVERYRGKAIFFGLGTLVHHLGTLYPPSQKELERRRARFGEQAHIPDPAFPHFPFNSDARMSGLAAVEIDPDGTLSYGWYPAQIASDGSTEPLRAGDPRASAITAYLQRITEQVGFDTRYEPSDRDGWAFVSIAGAPTPDLHPVGQYVQA